MKKLIVILALLGTFTAQSQATFPLEERLFYTGKIWGFLKYYHPEVGKGSFEWDEQLPILLEKAKELTDPEAFSDFYVHWIDQLGDVPNCNKCHRRPKKDPFLKNFDLSWLENESFSQALQGTLKHIEENRFQGRKHFYIDEGRVKQFKPRNEDPLLEMDWKIQSNRLLVLFRYWNQIEYFFPYKYLIDEPWDNVLKDLIPEFLSVKDEATFHLSVLKLIVRVQDTHAAFISPVLRDSLTFKYLPVNLRWVEGKVLVTQILDSAKASASNLLVGDQILEVNGKEVAQIHEENLSLLWGSNAAAKRRSVNYSLFFGQGDTVSLKISRDGETFLSTSYRFPYKELQLGARDHKPWKRLGDSIGYVHMGTLVVGQVEEMMEELKDSKAIIFDIRNYPKGTYNLISGYLKSEPSPFAKFTRPDFNYPGQFKWIGSSWCGKKNKDPYQGKVILLFDERTQSHAEFTCMCLQTAPNVISIGSQTAGADGNVLQLPLFDNLRTSLSGIGVYYPDGRETQRIGIVPDIQISPTIEGVRAGRDEVLEKALEIANKDLR